MVYRLDPVIGEFYATAIRDLATLTLTFRLINHRLLRHVPLGTLPPNFNFLRLLVLALPVRTGQTDRRTDGLTDRQPLLMGRSHNNMKYKFNIAQQTSDCAIINI